MISRLQKEILTDFPAPPQTDVEICHVDPALSEYLAPAFYITAPIDDISHNRIYINDAKMIRISITLQRLRMKDIPVICTRPSAPPPMVLRKSSPSSTILVIPKAGQPTPKCRLFIMPDLIRISPPCYSTTRLQHSASMPLRISGFIILDGKKKNAAFWSEYGVDDTATVKRITDLILEEPGNYLKYYVGYLKFRQMREQLALENKNFSVSAFHEAILRTGPSPFSVLEETVRDQLK